MIDLIFEEINFTLAAKTKPSTEYSMITELKSYIKHFLFRYPEFSCLEYEISFVPGIVIEQKSSEIEKIFAPCPSSSGLDWLSEM